MPLFGVRHSGVKAKIFAPKTTPKHGMNKNGGYTSPIVAITKTTISAGALACPGFTIFASGACHHVNPQLSAVIQRLPEAIKSRAPQYQRPGRNDTQTARTRDFPTQTFQPRELRFSGTLPSALALLRGGSLVTDLLGPPPEFLRESVDARAPSPPDSRRSSEALRTASRWAWAMRSMRLFKGFFRFFLEILSWSSLGLPSNTCTVELLLLGCTSISAHASWWEQAW